MSITNTTAEKQYTGDGVTTNFPTVFLFNTSSDIEVIERVIATGVETVLTLTTDYTVTGGGGAGVPATGTVIAVTAPAATVTWTLRRVVAEAQSAQFPLGGAFPSTEVEGMGDRIVMQVQQHSAELIRTLRAPVTDPSATLDFELPNSVTRANKFFLWDADGNPSVGANVSILVADGSAGSPSIAFEQDPDTGLYRAGSNTMGFATNGALAIKFDPNAIYVPNGQLSLPSFTFQNDQDTGFFRSAADQIGVVAGGTLRAVFAANSDGAGVLAKSGLRFDGAKSASPTGGLTIDFGATRGRFDVQSGSGFRFEVGGATILDILTGGQLRAVNGAAGAPTYSFDDDPNTGMYRAGADQIGFSVDGNLTFKIAPAGVFGLSGSVGAPSYSFEADPDTGIYRLSANQIGFTCAGTASGSISTGGVSMPNGSESTPAFNFTSDADLGMYRNNANSLGFSANGARQVVIGDGGGDGSDYMQLLGGNGVVEVQGQGGANIDVRLRPAGSGAVRFGTHSALAAETVSGYITIKDASGTSRKLAVVS